MSMGGGAVEKVGGEREYKLDRGRRLRELHSSIGQLVQKLRAAAA